MVGWWGGILNLKFGVGDFVVLAKFKFLDSVTLVRGPFCALFSCWGVTSGDWGARAPCARRPYSWMGRK